MIKGTGKYFLVLTTAVIICRCTKPYSPEGTSVDYGYLVVEGAIDAGSDSTIIKLSRTVKLSAKTTTRPELKAVLAVESEQGAIQTLKETTNGIYIFSGLNLDNTKKYRLSIKTTNGKTYKSDFVAVKNAPVIDSIGYVVKSDGVSIYNNAHDITNSTRYYRYDYVETWQFQSAFNSKYIVVNVNPPVGGYSRGIVPRASDQDIFTCWTSSVSNSILLGTTAKLTQDVLYQNPLTTVPSTSEKITIKYSMLLKQYALTTDAYNYWVLMKRNTEQLGSIFDAQPTEVRGNIHNTTDVTEAVIGYISVGVVQSKRIFISKSSLPKEWAPPSDCILDTALFKNFKTGHNDVAGELYSTPLYYSVIDDILIGDNNRGFTVIGFSYTGIPCADCTLRGVNKQPAFWK